MSNEIESVAPPGGTLYANVRDSSGQVWNGASFVAYVSANYSTYAIALTEQGGSGAYFGDFPSTWPTRGAYAYVAYIQAGGSQAEGDPIASTGNVGWPGIAPSGSNTNTTPALAPDFTVDNLVTSVKRRGMIPTNGPTLSTADIVALLDEEMRSKVMPIVKALKDEFWVTSQDQALVSGTTSYQIPYRAMGSSLRDVVFVDTNGNELALTLYDPTDIKFPVRPVGSPLFQYGYYWKDNSIVLWPTTMSNYTSYSLRMKYERRPNNLVSIASCAQISLIVGNTVTVSTAPSTFTTSVTYDIINHLPPFNSLCDDQIVVTVAGNDLTFSSLPAGVAVGNWVCLSMQSPIPQIPYEAFPLLSQYGVVRALASIGDMSALPEAKEELVDMVVKFNSLLTPRTEGTPKTLSGRNNIFNFSRNINGQLGPY